MSLTGRIYIRFSKEALAEIREKATGFQSISNYVRCAIAEFSDKDARDRMAAVDDMVMLLRKHQDMLSWSANNLNQAIRRANQLALVNMLSADYYNVTVIPSIQSFIASVNEMEEEQRMIARKVAKFK